ncbi:hypothetical protein [uncultured Kordia sp.]|uniref:hypothetical protein n=1 Tax=uncultured Kordia sp. TaxID=507699 RepID=UPI0026213A30|nr:hypothetical protein [uncultured Kordia sp.]
MIEIKFEESKKRTFKLYKKERDSRGKSFDNIIDSSSVDLSEVISQQITAIDGDNDPEMVHFLDNQDPEYRFNIIRIGCTFRTKKDEHFSKAWISVPMHFKENPTEKPLVWSLTPENVAEDVKAKDSIKISSELKFLKGEVSHEESTTSKDFFITSFREGKGSPMWEFEKTNNISINGSYACYIIIRTKKSDHIKGKVEIKTVLKEKTYIIFNKEKEMEAIPFLEFEIKPIVTN